MLRKRLVVTCLVGLVLCTTGLALAKAVKVDLVSTSKMAGVSGKAILNYAKGADVTQIQVNCRGLKPETEYTVFLSVRVGMDIKAGTFKVQEDGTGSCHAAIDGDVSALPVAIGDANGWEMVLTSP